MNINEAIDYLILKKLNGKVQRRFMKKREELVGRRIKLTKDELDFYTQLKEAVLRGREMSALRK